MSRHGKQHLVDQERRLREYATAREWIVVSTYTDAGFSGNSERRPGLQQMMVDTAVRAEPFDIVLVDDNDRFFRNVEGAALYRHLLAEKYIELISISAPPSAADEAKMAHRRIVETILRIQRDERSRRARAAAARSKQ